MTFMRCTCVEGLWRLFYHWSSFEQSKSIVLLSSFGSYCYSTHSIKIVSLICRVPTSFAFCTYVTSGWSRMQWCCSGQTCLAISRFIHFPSSNCLILFIQLSNAFLVSPICTIYTTCSPFRSSDEGMVSRFIFSTQRFAFVLDSGYSTIISSANNKQSSIHLKLYTCICKINFKYSVHVSGEPCVSNASAISALSVGQCWISLKWPTKLIFAWTS